MHAATFKVSLRQLAPDLESAGAELNARELGQIGATELNALLAKLAQFSSEKLIDADPHLTVSGRRGRFLVRPIGNGKLRLSDANDPGRDPLEIQPTEVAEYLDGFELKPVEVTAEMPANPPDATNTRTGLVAVLLLLTVGMVSTSAYLTFRPRPIDSEVEYTAITAPQQLASLRTQLTGTFATGTGDGSRLLTFRADGTLTWIEHGPDNAVVEERVDTYTLTQRDNIPVARTAWLGPIDLRDAKTLFYAGEVYTRLP